MTTDIARRFPDSLGFRTRADIPTFTDMTAFALTAFTREYLTATELAEIMRDISRYQDTAYYNSLCPRDRAVLMAAGMRHMHTLTIIEARQRRER